VVSGGTVECWGADLMSGSQTGENLTPVTIPGIKDATAVTAGYRHACALISDGTVQCWGTEDGLGVPAATAPVGAVVTVSGLSDAKAVTAGQGFTCALRTGGAIDCWGAGSFGDLGNDSIGESRTPVHVVGFSATVAPPVFGKTATVAPVSGKVLVRLPKTSQFVPLSAAETLPLGTQVDTTAGRARLTAARGPAGRAAAARASEATQTSLFYGGQFRITQVRASSVVRGGHKVGLTVLTLTGPKPSGCVGAHATIGVVAKKRPKRKTRSLWGNGKGNWQTVGTNASATVRGTEWLTEDTCSGTRVRVARGVVAVKDFRTHQTVLVRAGHSFLAKAKNGGSSVPPSGGPAPSNASIWSALGGKLICGVGAHAAGSPMTLLCADRVIPAPAHTTRDEGDPGFAYLLPGGTAQPARLSQYSWQAPNGWAPNGHKTLAAGQRWGYPGLAITCTIGASVVRCVNAAHHGFTITLKSYQAF
jgi:hypothetical protein